MTETILAATVIPVRDTDAGPEVLMLRKNSKLAFGGMWVFPGGRIDAGDWDPAAPDDELAAARVAAAREAREEADLVVAADAMVPFSHWTPPENSMHGPRRFLTWFFVCCAPEGEDGEVTIDGGEIHEDIWVRPADMLDRHRVGEVELVPPTFVTLCDLAAGGNVDDILHAAANRVPPPRYATRVGQLDDALVTMWSGDAGYETGDLEAPGPRHRVIMAASGWRLERSEHLL